ncbi:signal peptidase II [Niabella soli]|uniref:Lipoprotein signal peptidase n=1 Tax=Niabella soli DSM 19437 TaxID=929713 RepID=W0F2B5_9BACT|nr:signal peptidase II [Niabella soli]AHF15476.1 peptidase A8 [Niabella soli DSM 19437]
MKNKIVRLLILLLIVAGNLSCDQLSKSVVREKISYLEQVPVAGHFITLTRVENTGAFLSLGQTWPYVLKLILLIILPVATIFAVAVHMLRKQTLSLLTIIALGFIIGGGTGNLYDRVLYGRVTDFVHMDFHLFQTGIFNMADVSVMTGTLLMLAELILRMRRRLSNPAAGPV